MADSRHLLADLTNLQLRSLGKLAQLPQLPVPGAVVQYCPIKRDEGKSGVDSAGAVAPVVGRY